jgi:Ala-tRNA(Pro) deacylase
LTVIDSSFPTDSQITFEGNVGHEGVRMSYRDYEAIEAPIRARFAAPTNPTQAAQRRAG